MQRVDVDRPALASNRVRGPDNRLPSGTRETVQNRLDEASVSGIQKPIQPFANATER